MSEPLIPLRFVSESHDDHSADVSEIVRVFARYGFSISRSDARAAWQRYSDSMAAGWMGLDSYDDSIYGNVRGYFVEATP